MNGHLHRSLSDQIYDRERLVQEEVLRCMKVDGFDYTVVDPRLYLEVTPTPSYEFQPGSREWVLRYGFGVTTQAFEVKYLPADVLGQENRPEPADIEDPNEGMLNAMPDEEAIAWHERLAECFQRAQESIPRGNELTDQEIERERLVEEAVYADARVFLAYDDVSACVVERGYPPFSIFEPPEGNIVHEFGDLLSMNGEDLDEDAVLRLREAQRYEIGYATALHDCGYYTSLSELIHATRREYESGL